MLGSVQAALILRLLGVTSTLIRYEIEVFRKRKPEALKTPTLFLQFGLPSTGIRHENGAFRKRFANGGT